MLSGNRNLAVDLMKGIGILLVIIEHNDLLALNYYLKNSICSFHMPLFFILSGFFFRPSIDIESRIRRDFNRLLVPYFFIMFLLVLYTIIVHIFIHHDYWSTYSTLWMVLYPTGLKNSFIANSCPIWFLIALFWSRTIMNVFFVKFHNLSWILLFVLSVLSYIIYNFTFLDLPFAFFQGVSVLIFLLVGYSLNFFDFKYKGRLRMIIFSTFCVFMWLLSVYYANLNTMICKYDNYLISIIGACGATFIIYLVSLFLSHRNYLISKVLLWFGYNSMIVLCVHTLERYIPFWRILFPNPYLVLLMEFIICFLVTLVCYKFKITRSIFCLK